MNVLLTYRGRTVTPHDITFLRALIADHPSWTRNEISVGVCEEWDWRQPNGVLKDAVCRGLLLRLHRAGHIQLPPPSRPHVNRAGWHRRAPDIVITPTPLVAPLEQVRPLSFRLVRGTSEEPLFNALLHQHHELGYTHPVGEHLKYLVYSGERIVGKKVEPNSSLGGAISYMLNHWEELTLFLRVPNALNNNLSERSLKTPIRHRNNSLFYKTLRGAAVGDVYMSLIRTCYFCDADPFDYLTQLQLNQERVKAAPGEWLPWIYKGQLASSRSSDGSADSQATTAEARSAMVPES